MATAAETVDEYLAPLPAEQRAALEDLRRAIRSAAPEAEELISYGIPLYKDHGHLIGFGAFKDHLSLFIINSDIGRQFAEELAPFTVKHTTVQFTADNPLPPALVRKIVETRVAENRAGAA